MGGSSRAVPLRLPAGGRFEIMWRGLLGAVGAVVLAACADGSARPTATAEPWATYADSRLTFEHPSAWIERPQRFIPSTMGSTWLLLTTDPPAGSLCVAGPTTIGCDTSRLGALREGGVALIVGDGADLSPPGADQLLPVPDLFVDGLAAWESRDVSQSCGRDEAADQAVAARVHVVRGTARYWLYLTACGRRARTLEVDVRRLLASLRLPARR